MCGIAGFNLAPGSRLNARALAHELLSVIEYRGSHASGFGYSRNGDFGVYKNNVPGSQLPLTELPRRAKSVVLHTRFATQGSAKDNRNNHPVMSPEGRIALVHNGVISNDFMLRDRFERKLADVDTAVIPALIEREGLAGLKDMEGYAAVAWLNAADSKRGDILHLARLESSPVYYTNTLDGSFVFASTEEMLEMALVTLSIEYGHVFEMKEKEYFEVRNGVIVTYRDDVEMQDDWSAWARYGGATAGGHSTSSTSIIGGNEDSDWIYDPEKQTWIKNEMSWDDDYRSRMGTHAWTEDDEDRLDREIAMAMAPETNDPTAPELGFYLTDIDGAIEPFKTLEDLENHLAWLSQMVFHDDVAFPNAENKLRWINYVEDMGAITIEGGFESWFEDMGRVDEYESPAVRNLGYVREGISTLMGLRGF